jgi:predicted  nucleic acid-binding Zn-ribbon protein
VEELERQLLEWEELDDITIHHEHEVLSSRESALDRHDADFDREWKALEDIRAQVLARELDVDSREANLRDLDARLAVRERQLMEWRMQELAVT